MDLGSGEGGGYIDAAQQPSGMPMSRLPARHFHLVFSLLMGTTMVTLVTCIVTLVNVGPVPDFLARWGRAFAVAWWVAIPVLYFCGPRVRRMTGRLVEVPKP